MKRDERVTIEPASQPPAVRVPSYEDFKTGRFGTPWTVELGRVWGEYLERQIREGRER